MPRPSRQVLICTIGLLVLVGGVAWFVVDAFGKAHELELAEQAIERRDFKSAREHLSRYLADDPWNADALLLAARTARRDGELDEAGRLLDLHERVTGRSAQSQLERSLVAVQNRNAALAAQLLATSRADPDSEEAKLILEAILETTLNMIIKAESHHVPLAEQGFESTALPDAQAAIEIWFAGSHTKFERVQGLIWRARIRELTGDHPGALDDLRQALALEPDHRYANYFLALCRSQEAPEESRALLAALVAKHPTDTAMTISYCDVLRATGRVDEAKAGLARVLAREPGNAYVLVQCAVIELDLQRPADAEPLLRRALDAAPNQAEIHAAMSRCMRQLGRSDEAARHQDRFLQLERERPPKK